MLVQNNLVKLPYKLQTQSTEKVLHPTFKSNEMKPIDKLELGNISPLKSGLAKLDKITKKEYDSLTEQEKVALRSFSSSLSNYGHSLETDLRSHYFIADLIKTIMNKQFGEGNYVLMPIGRSLSSIGKLLELQIGKDNVKNIPLSKLGEYCIYAQDGFEKYFNSINTFTSQDGFRDFKEYLSSIGLSKELVENSDKNYVIIDYSFSGKSIRAAYDILTCDELLGNTKQNVCTVSINELLDIIKPSRKSGFEYSDKYNILEQFEWARFKPYSFVGGLHCDNIKDINTAKDYMLFAKKYWSQSCLEETIKTHKQFGFGLLDQEFSDKKYCQPNLSFYDLNKKYPNQNKYVWETSWDRLYKDVDHDTKEIYKVMGGLKKPVERLRYYNEKLQKESPETETLFHIEFQEINDAFNSLENLAKEAIGISKKPSATSGIEYYLAFRPRLFFKLKELSQKFSTENKTKILNLMEKRFNQAIKSLS